MGVRYKGSQGQTERTVKLQEEEEEVDSEQDLITCIVEAAAVNISQ
jgi:hypothetical protein